MALAADCQKPALFLAPMQDISDLGFMNIVADCGAPDIFMSEYFRIHECFEFEDYILEALLNPPAGKQVVAQFIGESELYIARAIEKLKNFPQIKMLDLNLGCPAPKIYKKNVGGGLLRDVKKIDSILSVMRENWQGSLSVKMRSGFASDAEFEPLFECVLKHSPDFVTVHARTVKQLYRGAPNYEVIARAVSMAGDIPVIANGDILSAKRAQQVLKSTSCAGLMVGRHAVRNPWIFRQIREQLAGVSVFEPTLGDVRVYVDRLRSNIQGEGARLKHLDSRLKKFLNFIAVGVDEGGAFLFDMRRANGIDELLRVCDSHLILNGAAEKKFALEPYANLCSRPNHEGD